MTTKQALFNLLTSRPHFDSANYDTRKDYARAASAALEEAAYEFSDAKTRRMDEGRRVNRRDKSA